MRHMEPSWSMELVHGQTAHMIASDRRHGNLGVNQAHREVDARRREIVDAPWSWLHQIHGATVLVVERAGHGAGTEADAACTSVVGAPIAVQVADCAPVAFMDRAGVIGVAHAGWRGLVAGVLESTVSEMRTLGASAPKAILGPCIRPAAYEFGGEDLDAVAAALGESVRSTTNDGAPALDLAAGVRSVLDRLDVELVAELEGCTSADADTRWSHRGRGDAERQGVVVWIDGT